MPAERPLLSLNRVQEFPQACHPFRPPLFVGLGSPHADDAVGWLVADALADRAPEMLRIRKAQAPLDLLDWLEESSDLWVCDGCRGLSAPGHWRRWTWPATDVELVNATGTHDFGLSAVLSLAERLGRLPTAPQIWGIEIESCVPGESINPAVARAVATVVDDVAHAAANASGFRSPAVLPAPP